MTANESKSKSEANKSNFQAPPDKQTERLLAQVKNAILSPITYHVPIFVSGKDLKGNAIIVIVSHQVSTDVSKDLLSLYFFNTLNSIVCQNSFLYFCFSDHTS